MTHFGSKKGAKFLEKSQKIWNIGIFDPKLAFFFWGRSRFGELSEELRTCEKQKREW